MKPCHVEVFFCTGGGTAGSAISSYQLRTVHCKHHILFCQMVSEDLSLLLEISRIKTAAVDPGDKTRSHIFESMGVDDSWMAQSTNGD